MNKRSVIAVTAGAVLAALAGLALGVTARAQSPADCIESVVYDRVTGTTHARQVCLVDGTPVSTDRLNGTIIASRAGSAADATAIAENEAEHERRQFIEVCLFDMQAQLATQARVQECMVPLLEALE
jgi:hypothetical protein